MAFPASIKGARWASIEELMPKSRTKFPDGFPVDQQDGVVVTVQELNSKRLDLMGRVFEEHRWITDSQEYVNALANFDLDQELWDELFEEDFPFRAPRQPRGIHILDQEEVNVRKADLISQAEETARTLQIEEARSHGIETETVHGSQTNNDAPINPEPAPPAPDAGPAPTDPELATAPVNIDTLQATEGLAMVQEVAAALEQQLAIQRADEARWAKNAKDRVARVAALISGNGPKPVWIRNRVELGEKGQHPHNGYERDGTPVGECGRSFIIEGVNESLAIRRLLLGNSFQDASLYNSDSRFAGFAIRFNFMDHRQRSVIFLERFGRATDLQKRKMGLIYQTLANWVVIAVASNTRFLDFLPRDTNALLRRNVLHGPLPKDGHDYHVRLNNAYLAEMKEWENPVAARDNISERNAARWSALSPILRKNLSDMTEAEVNRLLADGYLHYNDLGVLARTKITRRF